MKHAINVTLSDSEIEEAIRSFVIRKLEMDGITRDDRTVFVTNIRIEETNNGVAHIATAMAEVQE